jgi:hypothetical protein
MLSKGEYTGYSTITGKHYVSFYNGDAKGFDSIAFIHDATEREKEAYAQERAELDRKYEAGELQLCWECTGAGSGLGFAYCKVCMGIGYLDLKGNSIWKPRY